MASDPSSLDRLDDCGWFFDRVAGLADVLAMKLYRMQLDWTPSVPVLPCLDHEAMLHEGIAPHVAAYLRDSGGHLHEAVYIPRNRQLDLDIVSTMGECPDEARTAFVAALAERFPELVVHTTSVSWLRGDRRVAGACRAQVSLRDVLLSPELDRVKAAVDRLQTISSLMEKESRVASWASRTVMTPMLAVTGFVTFRVLGSLGAPWANSCRYLIVGLLGGYFLYYGLRAVHLTQMANRVWKRSAEYGLILSERRRLAQVEAAARKAGGGPAGNAARQD